MAICRSSSSCRRNWSPLEEVGGVWDSWANELCRYSSGRSELAPATSEGFVVALEPELSGEGGGDVTRRAFKASTYVPLSCFL